MRIQTLFKWPTWIAIFAFQLFSLPDMSAQCRFNCIDTVNVSVNFACNALITPEILLKTYDPATCNYGIELFDANNSRINLDATRADIGPQYVGQYLTARVYEFGVTVSSPNSCWTIIKVEDKLSPEIFCVGNDTLSCWGTDPFRDDEAAAARLKTQIERNLVDNCGNEEVTVNITSNILTRMLCQNDFAASRIVSYNVLDNNDNVTACIDTVYYERFELDSIDAPKNYIDNEAINCTEPYPSVEYLIGIDTERPGRNSLPNINGVSIADLVDSLFQERGLCNFKMTYTDLVFPNCGNTYKIVRNWTVIDWCVSSLPRTFNQVIKVADNSIRASGISNIGPLAAEDNVCDVNVNLPVPRVASNECNDWTYTISVREPDGTLFFPYGGTFTGGDATVSTRRFPIGVSTVRYTFTDACNNTDEREFTVTVEDLQDPVAVCDYATVVTLNDNFLGKAFAKSFDDNSFDHCTSIVSYQVRRVDRASTTCDTPADFADFVKFCCADVGRTIMVELQVTDENGMTATCMTRAVVQYKGNLGPSATCPANIGVQDCVNFDSFDITSLPAPTVTTTNPCISDLEVQVREVAREINECGEGSIDVEWYYNISGDDQVICTNSVTFQNQNIFNEADINWPTNRIVDSCDDAPATTTEISNLISDIGGYNNVIASEPVDRVFENVPGACRRILRTWTVVDWCRYPADPTARWTYDQQIDIINGTSPSIVIDGSNISSEYKPDNCRAHIILTGMATDDCTAAEDMVWTHRLDRIIEGQEVELFAETNGRIFENRIDAGSYIVTWTAMDQCGNISLARQNFVIEDTTDPVAVCGVAVRDMTSDGVTITALELDDNSSDNCNDQLTYAIRLQGSNTTPRSDLFFDCADLGTHLIELTVTDQSGNASTCIASVDIRDGAGTCGYGASIIGKVMTPNLITVESASVMLQDAAQTMQEELMTEEDGAFAFGALTTGQSYQVTVEKEDDYINGISTLDLILIQRHILGIQKLDSPYKLIAADVDNNQKVSAVDMVHLRRLLLGITEEFSDNDSWRFIDGQVPFVDDSYPWPLPESILVDDIQQQVNKDVYAIKIGDVDGSVIANSSFASTRSHSNFQLEKRTSVENGNLNVSYVASTDISAFGYQIGIHMDQTTMRLISARSKGIQIVDEMMHIDDDMLKISAATAYGIDYEAGDVVLELVFSAPYGDQVSLAKTGFESELYTLDGETLALQQIDGPQGWDMAQNQPNPFTDKTTINFSLPVDQSVTFEIFDLQGAQVYSTIKSYEAGTHSIEVDRGELSLNKGIYYYQIRTTERSLTKKMIIL